MTKIRNAKIEDMQTVARIQILSWQKAYKGIVPPEHLDYMDFDAHHDRWQTILSEDTDKTLFYMISDDAGQDLGFMHFGPPRHQRAGFDFELYAMYLHPDVWGNGHGGWAFTQALIDVRNAGHKNMYVWVLEDNKIGRRFYTKMGGTHIHGVTETVTIGNQDIIEVVYGWVSL